MLSILLLSFLWQLVFSSPMHRAEIQNVKNAFITQPMAIPKKPEDYLQADSDLEEEDSLDEYTSDDSSYKNMFIRPTRERLSPSKSSSGSTSSFVRIGRGRTLFGIGTKRADSDEVIDSRKKPKLSSLLPIDIITQRPESEWESLKQGEFDNRPDTSRLFNEPVLTDSHRRELTSYIMKLSLDNVFPADVTFNADQLFHRYIAARGPLVNDKADLVALTCWHIASKLLDQKAQFNPTLLAHVVKKHSREEIVAAEIDILQTLDFRLHQVTPLEFVYLLTESSPEKERIQAIASYLLQSYLFQSNYFLFIPSLLACTAVSAAFQVLGYEPWVRFFKYQSAS